MKIGKDVLFHKRAGNVLAAAPLSRKPPVLVQATKAPKTGLVGNISPRLRVIGRLQLPVL